MSVSGQGTWESTLQGRDLDGNLATVEAYYDTALDITWLADANYAKASGYDSDGIMTWTNATAWANGLTLGGYTDWRLPTTVDVGNDGATYTSIYQGVDYGFNITTHSEMSYMFYVTLGDKGYCTTSGVCPQPGMGLTNTGPFSNIEFLFYWSATEYAPDTSKAWRFSTYDGGQDSINKFTDEVYAWAVHPGDVGASVVPVPAAAWLFGSGLLGLVGMSRKRRA